MSISIRRITCVALSLCALALVACGDDDGPAPAEDMGITPPPPPPADMGPAVDTGPTTDAGPSGPPTCAEYCAAITTNCTGPNLQYQSADLCMEWCSTNYGWPTGNRDETTGNTLACRLYHGGTAAAPGGEAATTHCPHGGPSGGDLCGTWCENYCYLAIRNCTTEPLYMDMPSCMTACAMFDDTGVANAPNGNTVQCRIYHAGVAGGDDEAMNTHCPHAAQVPSDLCL